MITLNRIYVVLAGLLLGWWLLAATGGWEVGTPERERIPASARGAGIRSYPYGVVGYHGGK